MSEKKIYFLRHGETGMGGRYIGSTDLPLSDQGMEQIRNIKKLLQGKGINRIFSSPMLRCTQSLSILGLSCSYTLHDYLKEINFGRWENKNFNEIVAVDNKHVDLWFSQPDSFSFPGGEDIKAFRKRVDIFSEQLQKVSENTVLVISHGGVIRHLLCIFLRLPSSKYLAFDVRPGYLSSIRLYPQGGVLTSLNITD